VTAGVADRHRRATDIDTALEPEIVALAERVPGWAGRVRGGRPIPGGITNRNYLLDVAGKGKFVLRLSGKHTDLLLIDRRVELQANERAAALGLAPDVVAFLEPEQYLVTWYLDAEPLPAERLASENGVAMVADMVCRFHESEPLQRAFDCFTVPIQHAAAARARGVEPPPAYERALDLLRQAEQAFGRSPEPRCPCHNDLLNANFLASVDENGASRLWLLDWEYSGMNDRYFDLGNFAVNNEIGAEAEHWLLEAYFGAAS
jgi:thiamine kinase-like enzyme